MSNCHLSTCTIGLSYWFYLKEEKVKEERFRSHIFTAAEKKRGTNSRISLKH